MTNEDIRDQLDQRPFLPFRIHVVDGSSYNIGQSSFAILVRRTLRIGVDPDEHGLPRRSLYIDTRHISRIETSPPQVSGDER